MFKKITIAAVMAAVSFAVSAQVVISGKGNVWADSTKTGSVTANTIYTEPTSNFAIKATENLGGGAQARAVLETSIAGNTYYGVGTQLGDRQATVGVANKFGSVDFGRNVHSQFLAITNNDAFGTLYGSVAGDVHNLRGLRLSNGVFASAVVVPGVSLTYDRSNRDGLSQVVDSASYGLNAKVGPLNATVAHFVDGVEKSTVVGANATIGATTLFYSHSDNEGVVAKKGDLVGVSHKIGAITTKASYGKTNKDVTAYNVGVDYALSKRTEVGVAYRNVDAVATVRDVKQIGVGLTHRF
jgi:predicted porin